VQKLVLFYPLPIAILPIVFLASQNEGEVPMVEVLAPLAVVLAATLLFTLVLRLLIKDSVKVATIVSILLLIFFSYGHIFELFDAPTGGGGRNRFMIPLALIGIIASFWLVIRYQGNLKHPLKYSSLGAVILVSFNVGVISLNNIGQSAPQVSQSQISNVPIPLINGVDELPDIYYIILDEYGRADVLNTVHGFDNTEFVEFLEGKGFFVASESRTNYPRTQLSLASSLNMRYLDIADRDTKSLIQDNEVIRLVKQWGYKTVHLDSGVELTTDNPNASVRITSGPNRFESALRSEFSASLLRSTIVGPTIGKFLGYESFFVNDWARIFRGNMRMLMDIPRMTEATFTFNHNLPPHKPYIFDKNGNVRSSTSTRLDGGNSNEVGLYLDQLLYVNKVIEAVVESILSQSSVEPIIIIQGDHGPQFTITDDSWKNPEDVFVFERTGILNAYYLPESCKSGLYPSISPVNTFRLVFDNCIGSEFGLLADEAYFDSKGGHARHWPWEFFTVPPVHP